MGQQLTQVIESMNAPSGCCRAGLRVGTLIALCLLAMPVGAQETIVSDRPGIGSGAALVPSGLLQLETGFEHARLGPAVGRAYGQVLVRIGAPIELQIHGNSYTTLRDRRGVIPSVEGFEDVGFGVKIPIVRGRMGGRLDLSFQGFVTIPTGAAGVTEDNSVQYINVLGDIGLSDAWAVSINLGRAIEAGTATTNSVIVTPAVSLTDQWGAFFGWAADLATGEDTHFAEGGVTYLATSSVQLDVNGGWRIFRDTSGLVPEARRWFIGTGIAIRGGNNWLIGR